MRAIAREAGVATGNAYYYFSSKEDLIQQYYARNAEDLAAACHDLLAAQTRFGPRLRGVLRALVESQAPYRSFAATVYARATDTASPLSPFSAEACAARATAIALYAEVVSGSRLRVPGYLRERLPSLLWLYSIGIMLFWARDNSPGAQRTMRLIDATVPLTTQMIGTRRSRRASRRPGWSTPSRRKAGGWWPAIGYSPPTTRARPGGRSRATSRSTPSTPTTTRRRQSSTSRPHRPAGWSARQARACDRSGGPPTAATPGAGSPFSVPDATVGACGSDMPVLSRWSPGWVASVEAVFAIVLPFPRWSPLAPLLRSLPALVTARSRAA